MMGLVRLYVEPGDNLPPQHVPDDYRSVIDIVPEDAQRVRRNLRRQATLSYLGSSLMAGFDATLGGSAATSYISVDEADALLLNTRYNPTWQGNTEADKSQYLVSATFWLEQLTYAGTRCSPSTDNPPLPQALAWPRSGATCDGVEATCGFIPKQIKQATAILAAELTANPDIIGGPIGGAAAPPKAPM